MTDHARPQPAPNPDAAGMTRDEALQRRVYRLALLLTDRAAHAEAILTHVVEAHRDLRAVGESQLEQHAVFDARVWRAAASSDPPAEGSVSAMLDPDSDAAELWRTVVAMPGQPREAWILRDLEGVGPVPAARAMDCSRNAINDVHLPAARSIIDDALGSRAADARQALAHALEAVRADAAIDAAARRRRAAATRRRALTAVGFAALLVCFGLMLYVLVDLLGWDERQAERRINEDTFSNPIPGPETTP